MDKKRKHALMALGFGALALLGNKFYLDTERDNLLPKNHKSVVVVSRHVPAGTRISNKQLKRSKVPEKYLPKTRILWADRDQFVGQEVSVDVPSGDYLLQNHFIERVSVGHTLSAQLSGENVRAINLPVDETNSLARSIVSGDKIDIVLTFTVPRTSSKLSTILLQNVPVISTGSYSIVEQQLGAKGGRPQRYNSLTLALNAEDAFRLNYAREAGRVSILLRNSGDNNILDVQPIKGLHDLLSAQDRETVAKLVKNSGTGLSQAEQDKFRQQMAEVLKQGRQQSLLNKK